MVDFNGSFAFPLADASVVAQLANPSELVSTLLNGLTIWTGMLYLVLAAIFYDQGKICRTLSSNVCALCSRREKKNR